MKKCSGCRYFTKMKQMKGNSGICEFFDARTNEDHKCDNHKAIPYDRNKFKKVVDIAE